VIYIRDVEIDISDEALQIARNLAKEGRADLFLVQNSYAVVVDAVQRGFIRKRRYRLFNKKKQKINPNRMLLR
jgi:hypothetical protein